MGFLSNPLSRSSRISIGSRIGRIASGIGDAIQAPFGLIKDFAIAPFKDQDDFDGFVNTIYQRTKVRGGQALGNLFGPREGLGAAIGALPKGVRTPVGQITKPVFEGIETVYREGIAEPITTGITAASLQQAGAGFDVRQAYKIAQTRSPGQALALAFGTKDILNKAEVARYQGTDQYEHISGVTDVLSRIFLDPTVLGGKAAKVARREKLVRPIRTFQDIEKAVPIGPRQLQPRRYRKFKEEVMGKSAEEIRHRFYPDHPAGSIISPILADAAQLGDEVFDHTVRGLMGDPFARQVLDQKSAHVSGMIDRLYGELGRGGDLPSAPKGQGQLGLYEKVDVGSIKNQINELYDQQDLLARQIFASKMIAESPRASTLGGIRAKTSRTDFYQKHALAAPLRSVFNMKPHRLIELHSPTGDVQLRRMLRLSRLELDAQDGLLNEYLGATTEAARMDVLLRAEKASVTSIVNDAVRRRFGDDLDSDEFKAAQAQVQADIDDVMGRAAVSRQEALQTLKSRAFDADLGDDKSVLTMVGEDGVPTRQVLWVSQNANVLPLVDVNRIRKAATRYADLRARFPGSKMVPEAMETFYHAWKPAVLLRFGWPLRVVGDEQMRIWAKIGALTQIREQGRAFKAYTRDVVNDIKDPDVGIRDAIRAQDKGHYTFKAHEYEMFGAMGAPGEMDNYTKILASSRPGFQGSIVRNEQKLLKELRETTGEFRTFTPDAPEYARSWEHAVNKQIGQDTVGQKMLSGETDEQILRWLTREKEGILYGRRNPTGFRNPEAWIADMRDQVNRYLPFDELREKALKGRAKADDLVNLIPDASSRPPVHGEVLAQAFGQSVITKRLDQITSAGYRFLGSLPSDVLSRNRFVEIMHRMESERQVNIAVTAGTKLDEVLLRQIEDRSRIFAVGEARKLLYDLRESSQFGEMVRFFIPFYGAFQEVITRWAGLAVENPGFVAQMRQVWKAPERFGIVQDENGQLLNENGEVVDEDGKKIQGATAGEDKYVTVRLPEWARDIPGLKTQGGVKFNKKSFNLALQGTPGFGPPVQIAVNAIVKDRPDLEESVKMILPFGTTQEWKALVMPSQLKRLTSLSKGEEDRVFFNSMMRIYWDKVTDYELGKRKDKPTYKEALRETKQFYSFRWFASLVAPAAPSFTSPYQIQIDAYRALKEADPETADEKFLDEYGDEFFALTQSLSKSKDGVPPTIEGFKARKKYQDLIEKHPELGGLIVGSEGAGEFARAVYDSQLAKSVRPGSSVKQRERPDFETAAIAPNVRLGWIEFQKSMNLINAERVQRGLPNLQVKKARDLAETKRQVIENLMEKYPEWGADFQSTDKARVDRRLKAMREIVSDERLLGRDDIQGLKEYLEARDAVAAELKDRAKRGGAKTLTSASNQDLAQAWDSVVSAITEKNLAFEDLHSRWLERDLPEVS